MIGYIKFFKCMFKKLAYYVFLTYKIILIWKTVKSLWIALSA